MADHDLLIEQMRLYYDQRVPWHDWYMDYRDSYQMAARQRPILDLIMPHLENKRVLEIACGTGNWTHLIASIASEVFAIDSSPASLSLASEKLAATCNVTLHESDAYNLSEEIPPCDVVFAADFYSHIPKSRIRPFLESVHHRTGARIGIFVDMLIIDYFRNEESVTDNDGNRVSKRTLPDGTSHLVIKNFPTEQDLRKSIQDLQGSVLDIRDSFASVNTTIQSTSIQSASFQYFEFPDLHRWLLIYHT